MQLLSQMTTLDFEVRKAGRPTDWLSRLSEAIIPQQRFLEMSNKPGSLFMFFLTDPQDVMNVCCALLWPDLPEEVAAQAR